MLNTSALSCFPNQQTKKLLRTICSKFLIRNGLLRNKLKNKGLEYNKWIFQDLEKLIQVKM